MIRELKNPYIIMSDTEKPETSWSNQTLSLMGGVGFILLFLLILWVAYLPYRPEPIAKLQGEERLRKLSEIQNEAKKKNTTYGVVNPNEGVYRIPVEEAMRLTVEEFRRAEDSSSEQED
jgi:hypothetical protein